MPRTAERYEIEDRTALEGGGFGHGYFVLVAIYGQPTPRRTPVGVYPTREAAEEMRKWYAGAGVSDDLDVDHI